MKPFATTRGRQSIFFGCLLSLALASSSTSAQQAEPAGLPPLLAAEQHAIELPTVEGVHAQSNTPALPTIAGTSTRPWLAPSGKSKETPEPSARPGMGSLFAAIVLVGVAGASVFLARRRKRLSASANSSGQLSVLSSCRIGPKAHAVSLQADGRVYLLGVTEHAVCQIAALPPPLEAPKPAEAMQGTSRLTPAEEVLRRAASNDVEEEEEEEAEPGALASADHLRRFQALLRSSLAAPEARPSRSPPRDAASRLASSLRDVVTTQAPPKSLRRSRRRRAESQAVQHPQATASGAAPTANYEGQVAGLKNLRSG